MKPSTQETAQPPVRRSLLLFAIGFSGGLVAVSYPRLATFLSEQNATNFNELIDPPFLLAVTFFSILIGIVMIWFHMGSDEKPKNLFMSALALPAILSGSMSTSNALNDTEIARSAAESERNNAEITRASSVEVWDQALKQLNRVDPSGKAAEAFESALAPEEEVPEIARLEPADDVPVSGWVSRLFGASSAHAAEIDSSTYSPGEERLLLAQQAEASYVTMVDKGTQNQMRARRQQLQGGTPGPGRLSVLQAGNTYYLVYGQARSKQQAALDVVRLRKALPGTSPKLLKVP